VLAPSDVLLSQLKHYMGTQLFEQLMAYQRLGVQFAVRRNGRAMIADEMGLGKTMQAVGVMADYRGVMGPHATVVICPAAVRTSWKYHIQTYMGVETTVILKWTDDFSPGDITIVETTLGYSLAWTKVTRIELLTGCKSRKESKCSHVTFEGVIRLAKLLNYCNPMCWRNTPKRNGQYLKSH
jgi:SNF2-related domain